MGWKKWPSWLKGGVIGLIIYFLGFLFMLIIPNELGLILWVYPFYLIARIFNLTTPIFDTPILPFWFLSVFLSIFILIGAFIGWIVGIIKKE